MEHDYRPNRMDFRAPSREPGDVETTEAQPVKFQDIRSIYRNAFPRRIGHLDIPVHTLGRAPFAVRLGRGRIAR
jgi:hypothetical protein